MPAHNPAPARPPTPVPALFSAPAAWRPIFPTTGGISGTLTLTTLTNNSTTNITSVSGRTAIQASAELLSSDTTNPHHVIIASAPVQSDGTFTIYPLQSNSANPTVYDVVSSRTQHRDHHREECLGGDDDSESHRRGSDGRFRGDHHCERRCFARHFHADRDQLLHGAGHPVPTTNPLPGGAAVTFYQTLPASGEVPLRDRRDRYRPGGRQPADPRTAVRGDDLFGHLFEQWVHDHHNELLACRGRFSIPSRGDGTFVRGCGSPG